MLRILRLRSSTQPKKRKKKKGWCCLAPALRVLWVHSHTIHVNGSKSCCICFRICNNLFVLLSVGSWQPTFFCGFVADLGMLNLQLEQSRCNWMCRRWRSCSNPITCSVHWRVCAYVQGSRADKMTSCIQSTQHRQHRFTFRNGRTTTMPTKQQQNKKMHFKPVKGCKNQCLTWVRCVWLTASSKCLTNYLIKENVPRLNVVVFFVKLCGELKKRTNLTLCRLLFKQPTVCSIAA